MKSIDRWGPFAPDLEPGELRARLRSLRAIVRLLLGPRGDALARMLHCAESGAVPLAGVLAAVNRLPSLDMRRVLSSYAALTKPSVPCEAS